MKTLWVHIGMSKTASTAIQAFCGENAKVLARHGFCFPTLPFHYPGISKAHNGYFLLGVARDKDGKRDREKEAKNFREGMRIVHKLFLSNDNIILSDESIWRAMDIEKQYLWDTLKQEAEKGGFQIRVIVYLRRQDKFFPSIWNQTVKKKGLQETYEEYVERADKFRLNYYEKLERMASVVGKENITVRRFEREHFVGGTIYEDFLSVFGLSLTDEYSVSQEVRNIGLYGNTHEIKRVLNSLPEIKDSKVQGFIVKCLLDFSKISQKEYPSEMLSKEEVEAFLAKYGSGNRKVAEEYLHEPGAELFDNTVKDLPKWEKDNPYMIDDLIRFTGSMGIRLHQENQELKKEVAELRRFVNHVRHPFKTVFRRIKRFFRSKKR